MTAGGISAPGIVVPTMQPETRFVRSGGVDIAYQVVGEGPTDLVVLIGWISHLELMWELPELAHFLERLAGMARVIVFDKRGVGLSDRVLDVATVEDIAGDTVAVMDAVGSRSAAILGWLESAAAAITTAARHPDRVSALVLGEPLAVGTPDDDHPWGLQAEVVEQLAQAIEQGSWGEGVLLPLVAPEGSEDPRVLTWWRRWERVSATPNMAANLLRTDLAIDVRPYLPLVRAGSLVLHRTGTSLIHDDAVRWLASRLPDAHLVELSGGDVPAFLGDADGLLDEIEDFVVGTRSGGAGGRALLTLLYTDVVDSTATIARLGDSRWRASLAAHRATVRRLLARYGGTEVDTAGDGFLATFSSPSSAIRCALDVRDAVEREGMQVRLGLHAAEVLRRDEGIAGLGVHIGARIAALAGPGEVLVSRTVSDLVAGASFRFESLGTRQLKGVPGAWEVQRLTDAGSTVAARKPA